MQRVKTMSCGSRKIPYPPEPSPQPHYSNTKGMPRSNDTLSEAVHEMIPMPPFPAPLLLYLLQSNRASKIGPEVCGTLPQATYGKPFKLASPHHRRDLYLARGGGGSTPTRSIGGD